MDPEVLEEEDGVRRSDVVSTGEASTPS